MAIISITGKIGSGKDTAAEIIKELAPEYGWEIKKFAGKLKTVASILTNIPVEKFEDQEFKKTFLSKEWSYWTPDEEVKDMSVRELLQLLGTEAMRNGLHPNTWVNALWSDYTDKSNWIITDTTDNPASSNSLINAGFKIYTPSAPWSFKHAIYWKYKIDQTNALQRPKRSKKKAGVA